MADVAENATYTDAAMAISQGKRHLLVQDYTAAVTALAEGLEMMSQKLGDCDDELGEPYLLYGRALLGLAREEAGVLGGGVPGSEESDEDEEDEDEEECEVDDNAKDKENDGKVEGMETNESDEKKCISEKQEAVTSEGKSKNEKDAVSNKTDDKKIEEIAKETTDKKVSSSEESTEKVIAGTSKDCPENGAGTSKSQDCNGVVAGKSSENMEDDEDVNKEDDEEDPGRGIDLQVAWEVLELAKIVFKKRGESGLKQLAETHRLLGEVAMESDNPQGAIADLESALELLEKMEPCEPRALADIHYQLGLAHSLANDFDSSITQFNEATNLLEARIKQLEDTTEPQPESDNIFYTVEGEIQELRELLPAIKEKIVDMKDFKEEACRMVIEGIKNKVISGGCTNGASSSSSNNAGSSSSSEPSTACPIMAKPASDISHLVRKKRKNETDTEEQGQSPCKKATP